MEDKRPPKPEKPEDLETRVLAWRPRARHWTAFWLARPDLIERGYPVKSRLLWPQKDRPAIPTRDDWEALSRACDALQDEMLTWYRGATKADPALLFDDTIASLTTIYIKHKESPFHKLRHYTQITYERRMNYVARDFGLKKISKLTIADFNEMYDFWLAPNAHSKGKRRISHAHEQMVFLKLALRFGKGLKLTGCKDAEEILSDMEFQLGRQRTTIVDDGQINLLCAEAHRIGKHSIAFAQRLQDGLIVRQKDVIGEWIPISDPGISDIHDGNEKCVAGFRWEELDEKMTLKHRLSKSIRGRDALADPDDGKVMEWIIPLYPHIMEEMARIAGVPVEQLTRDKLPSSGPMVVAEHSELPWIAKVFSQNWRKIASAKAVGIPKNVQNRDTRASGATDAKRKGAKKELIRDSLGHSLDKTTDIYLRDPTKDTSDIAVIRFGKKDGS